MDCKNARTIIKTRLELLNLGYQPYIRNEDYCRRCQRKGRDDTVHYFAKCPSLMNLRSLIFGRAEIRIKELGHNYAKLPYIMGMDC